MPANSQRISANDDYMAHVETRSRKHRQIIDRNQSSSTQFIQQSYLADHNNPSHPCITDKTVMSLPIHELWQLVLEIPSFPGSIVHFRTVQL